MLKEIDEEYRTTFLNFRKFSLRILRKSSFSHKSKLNKKIIIGLNISKPFA